MVKFQAIALHIRACLMEKKQESIMVILTYEQMHWTLQPSTKQETLLLSPKVFFFPPLRFLPAILLKRVTLHPPSVAVDLLDVTTDYFVEFYKNAIYILYTIYNI